MGDFFVAKSVLCITDFSLLAGHTFFILMIYTSNSISNIDNNSYNNNDRHNVGAKILEQNDCQRFLYKGNEN